MTTINLREFYPTAYTNDEFIEVSDEVAAELIADKRYEAAQKRRTFYNKAHYSLDANDGIETESVACYNDSPERIFDLMERHCGLCRALNSLPEVQGLRIEAHYLLGKSIKEIADADGVNERRVRKCISRGLVSMKIYLQNFS